jgi:single-stranded-DNA-specific exonuclease
MSDATTNVNTVADVTLSLTGRPWILREADERQVLTMMQKHALPDVLARILVARGIALDDVDDFLNPSLKNLMPDPSHLLDMDVAAQRVASAIMSGERMAIFGDYDVDGATSSALLMRFFRSLGSDPLVYIPDRMKEGYGPNSAALLSLKDKGAALVITVDCGTLSFEPLEVAHNAGLDVIVIDHHQGEARKPKALAIVNPNRLDESSEHRHLAAVGVAFLLAVAVNRLLREQGWYQGKKEPDLRQWLDIVALGTVCDVVPLVGVNRAFVAQGLKIMSGRGNTGMNAVFDRTGIDEKPSTYHAGFVLGPRINAGGRVGKSDLGVRLLTAEDPHLAAKLAEELENYNAERKAIESAVLEEAMQQAERQAEDSPIIIACGQGWHPGVIGIVAGRLKERFFKPVAVIGIDNGVGKASARSVSGFDFGSSVIAACDNGLLVAGGGHAMAAGFTVEEDKIPALRAFLAQRVQAQVKDGAVQKRLFLDCRLSVSGATAELVAQMERLGPFGQANPNIRVVVQNVVPMNASVVGQDHVRMILVDRLSNSRLSAIAFRAMNGPLGDLLLTTKGKALDVAGQLRLQEWNGRQTLSLQVDDVAESRSGAT